MTIRTSTQGFGRLTAQDAGGHILASVPYLIRPPQAPDVPLGPLALTKGGRAGHFTLGSFSRGDPLTTGTRIRFAEKLVLTIVNGQIVYGAGPFSDYEQKRR